MVLVLDPSPTRGEGAPRSDLPALMRDSDSLSPCGRGTQIRTANSVQAWVRGPLNADLDALRRGRQCGKAAFDGGESVLRPGAVGTAGLGEIGTAAAALAAERFRAAFYKIDRIDAGLEIIGNPDYERSPTVGDGYQHHHA